MDERCLIEPWTAFANAASLDRTNRKRDAAVFLRRRCHPADEDQSRSAIGHVKMTGSPFHVLIGSIPTRNSPIAGQ